MIKKTLGGNMSNIARFMTDTKYADEFNQNQLNSLWLVMLSIQRSVNGMSPNLQDAVRRVTNNHMLNNQTYSEKLKGLTFKKLKKTLSYLKAHLDKSFADFGDGRNGLPTTLVSINLKKFKQGSKGEMQFDTTGLKPSDPDYPVKEHFYTLGQVGTWMMIWDCIIGRWVINFDDTGAPINIEGLDYINAIYPTFHIITYVTSEENLILKNIVNDMIKEHTDKEGIVHWDTLRDELREAEHYKRAGIVFHKDDIAIGTKRPIHPSLVPQSLIDLKGKKSSNINMHKFW
tara:strand:- start:56 stop:916 length:861 start_codon:yes stop_codon:yes gene_type:complete